MLVIFVCADSEFGGVPGSDADRRRAEGVQKERFCRRRALFQALICLDLHLFSVSLAGRNGAQNFFPARNVSKNPADAAGHFLALRLQSLGLSHACLPRMGLGAMCRSPVLEHPTDLRRIKTGWLRVGGSSFFEWTPFGSSKTSQKENQSHFGGPLF